jgi:hypothetical protein
VGHFSELDIDRKNERGSLTLECGVTLELWHATAKDMIETEATVKGTLYPAEAKTHDYPGNPSYVDDLHVFERDGLTGCRHDITDSLSPEQLQHCEAQLREEACKE